MNEKTKEYREQIAQTFIHILEEKPLQWIKEWDDKSMWPLSAQTGKMYHGINRFYLSVISMQEKYQDNRWATFNQISKNGWQLHDAKGKGIKVEYWYPYDREQKRVLSWDEFRKNKLKIDNERYFLKAKYAVVFNGDLITGIPDIPEINNKEVDPDLLINTISQNMNVEILFDGGDRSYYNVQTDKIHLPRPEKFLSSYAFDATALHELAHATGAQDRLNRIKQNIFGDENYLFEELVAEITSCFMSPQLAMDLPEDHMENHKAYVQGWITNLRNKPEALIVAVKEAERVANYLDYQAGLITKQEYEKTKLNILEVPESSVYEEKKINIKKCQNLKL
ncbi:ArdC family protein [Cuneatibacter caecimuris]|uniref:Antirestriction protein ArdC n=1 Tax=Cuneatibacter caecimuris TaxID=1796618 RepID=A0A4Q7PPS2_9FIRM|nr:zincin-like metallopeptidase domain-containing protein [Cuneatibacter caecimuris]RZT01162.1 antirestriction protein ArdC [Cuneatibacter caecimuris]